LQSNVTIWEQNTCCLSHVKMLYMVFEQKEEITIFLSGVNNIDDGQIYVKMKTLFRNWPI